MTKKTKPNGEDFADKLLGMEQIREMGGVGWWEHLDPKTLKQLQKIRRHHHNGRFPPGTAVTWIFGEVQKQWPEIQINRATFALWMKRDPKYDEKEARRAEARRSRR